MIPLENKNLEKNYLLALVLSLMVLFFYPVLLQHFSPKDKPAQPTAEETRQEIPSPSQISQKAASPLSEDAGREFSQGPFLEQPIPPTITHYENTQYEAEFSTLGGTLIKLVYKGDSGKKAVTKNLFFQGDMYYPGLFGLRLRHDPIDLNQSQFKMHKTGSNVIEFIFEKAGEYKIVKKYTFGKSSPIIAMDLILENISSREKIFPIEFSYGMSTELDEPSHQQPEAVVLTDKIQTAPRDRISKKGFLISEKVEWAGVLKRYFALLIKPDWRVIAQDATVHGDVIWGQLTMDPITLQPSEGVTRQFFIYAGPQRYETLKDFEVGFERILSRGFFGMFKLWLLLALKFSHRITHNFGWDIILLTLLIKGLFAPLTHMSYQSMEKMKAVQPKVKALQEKYKKDHEKLNREMMDLYRRYKVNPMAGCLPMLLQIPIFIAFYQVLFETIELKGAPFIGWITDLSAPDHLFMLPFTIPLVKWNSFNLLPIVMTVSMYYQQKLTPQTGTTPEQQKIFALMPVFFAFIFYNMPSGLVLYWFVNNLLSIIQQVFVKRLAKAIHHDDPQEA